MSRQMGELQALLSPEDRNVQLVSLTTDPEFDTPEVLARYANKFKAQPDRWWFMTGGKPEMRRLAVEGLKLVVSEKAPEERDVPADLFVHSTLFVVVDQQARLRVVFETQPQVDDSGQTTTNPDTHWAQTRGRILEVVRRLRAER
jgi:cytochrome oxidase Cu insertion factor (SCO1/SenC/PrrC family)